jgi:hypothetical protein
MAEPAVRITPDSPQFAAGGPIPLPNQGAFPIRRPGDVAAPLLDAAGPGGPALAAPAGNLGARPLNAPGAAPLDEGLPAEEPRAALAANMEAVRAEEPEGLDDAPPPRLRGLRFLSAAESLRENELENRLKRLEGELEAANDRLQSNDSMTVRIDARLDRARLETDLDMVARQIGRLRMERVFSRAATASVAPVEQEPSASPNVPSLNLLA